jgi:S-adenosylmethionine hydrolase
MITFLSDYGLEGSFVGMCHGVMSRICPDIRVIDVTHDIPRHDILAGALAFRDALPYLPVGVHLAVVDPGVGGERRAVAIRTEDDQFVVGPDNGILSPGVSVLGGAKQAFDIGESSYRLQPVSSTFHGRDIFAPVTAHLAAGLEPEVLGSPVELETLVTLRVPVATVRDGTISARVLGVDRFGNVVTDASHADLERAGICYGNNVRLAVAGRDTHIMRCARTFGDVEEGERLAFVDAQGHVAVAVNRGSAADRLGLAVDSEIEIGRD